VRLQNTSPAFPVRCFKPFITNHRHYNHHHQLRATARGWGKLTASLSREGNQTDDWREPQLHVSMPLQPCTVIFTAHCSKRKERKGEIHTPHSSERLYTNRMERIATQPSESPIKKLENVLSVNSS
jgi:hypothetical protein